MKRKKSLIAFLLFSFTFLMTHDYIMQVVDQKEPVTLQQLDPSPLHSHAKVVEQVHDALDSMVLHFYGDDKPKTHAPICDTLFHFTLKHSSVDPAFLERPPTV